VEIEKVSAQKIANAIGRAKKAQASRTDRGGSLKYGNFNLPTQR